MLQDRDPTLYRQKQAKTDRDELLGAACNAVHMMPRLDILEMWHSGAGSAAIFKYARTDHGGKPPLVVWITTWPPPALSVPQRKAFQRWRDLARSRDPARREPAIVTYTASLTDDELKSHFRVLLDLELREFILSPVLFVQVEWEHFEKQG